MKLKTASFEDMMLYFIWANDSEVRQNSINKSPISFRDHQNWFSNKIKDSETIFLIFEEDGVNVGQLRIDLNSKTGEAIINFSIDKKERGKGLGTKMLILVNEYYTKLNLPLKLIGYVKFDNKASSKAFEKAGFKLQKEYKSIQGEPYWEYRK